MSWLPINIPKYNLYYRHFFFFHNHVVCNWFHVLDWITNYIWCIFTFFIRNIPKVWFKIINNKSEMKTTFLYYKKSKFRYEGETFAYCSSSGSPKKKLHWELWNSMTRDDREKPIKVMESKHQIQLW